jgi:hypothetical protein
VDLGKGLACRGHCEEDVRLLVRLDERTLRVARNTGRYLRTSRLLWWGVACLPLAAGALVIAIGVIDPRLGWAFIFLGALLALFGVFLTVWLLRLPSVAQETKELQESENVR